MKVGKGRDGWEMAFGLLSVETRLLGGGSDMGSGGVLFSVLFSLDSYFLCLFFSLVDPYILLFQRFFFWGGYCVS